MKNFLSVLGAITAAIVVFAAVAVIVKKVKFKFVVSSADADGDDICDYDCDNCEEKCEDYEDDFDNWDDIPVEEPEIEFELTETADDSVSAEVESELGEDK